VGHLHYGISQATGLKWAVKGAGQVGSRVIHRVLPEAQRIYVSDQSPERRSLLQEHASVTIVPSSEIADSPADALIFAADSGSLDVTAARNIAGNRHILACGGPEAGLDHDGAAIEIVASAGKYYVPSVLCGSLGLISNLEEILGSPLMWTPRHFDSPNWSQRSWTRHAEATAHFTTFVDAC